MVTYLVINTKTSEIYQRNGTAAEFGTFHQARQIRITLNDQGKIEHNIVGAVDTWTERPNTWQIIDSSTVGIKRSTKSINKRLASGIYAKVEEVVFHGIGDIKPIKRAPNTKSGRRSNTPSVESASRDVAQLQAEVKSYKARIEAIDARIKRTEPGERMLRLIERKVKYQTELSKITTELRDASKALMASVVKRRKSQQAENQQTTSSKPVMIRRRSS